MLKYMYFVESKFKVRGSERYYAGHVGGNDPMDARSRHLSQLTNIHGPISEFLITSLTQQGDFAKLFSELVNREEEGTN